MLKKGLGISTFKGADRRRARLIILAYHAIADLGDDRMLAEYGVPPALFGEQLAALAGAGWEFVGLDAVLTALGGGGDLPRRAVLLSFDDAYADLLDACAQLEEHRAPGLVFAVADRIGGSNAWDVAKGATELALLDGAGLREVAARGVEIGCHTASHCSLPEVPPERLPAEIAAAGAAIEAAGVPRPRAFSYPYGEWTPALAAAVREAGYEAAFTVEWGAVSAASDRFAIPRVEVHASDTPSKLLAKLSSATWPAPIRDATLRLRGVRLNPSAS